MLPDFPKTKNLFSVFLQTYMRRKLRSLSPFRDSKVSILHEGRSMKTVREDRTESITVINEISSMTEIQNEEIKDQTFEKVLDIHEQIIRDLVNKQTNMFMEQISRDLPESQTVNAKGRKMGSEIVLEMLETIMLEFDEDGNMSPLNLLGGAFTPEKMKKIDAEFENSIDLQRRRDEIIRKKKEEWLDREASRKLVG